MRLGTSRRSPEPVVHRGETLDVKPRLRRLLVSGEELARLYPGWKPLGCFRGIGDDASNGRGEKIRAVGVSRTQSLITCFRRDKAPNVTR